MEEIFFRITREKGDIEFGVSSAIIDLTPEEYNEVRELLVVAIGVMEDMRRKYYREGDE